MATNNTNTEKLSITQLTQIADNTERTPEKFNELWTTAKKNLAPEEQKLFWDYLKSFNVGVFAGKKYYATHPTTKKSDEKKAPAKAVSASKKADTPKQTSGKYDSLTLDEAKKALTQAKAEVKALEEVIKRKEKMAKVDKDNAKVVMDKLAANPELLAQLVALLGK